MKAKSLSWPYYPVLYVCAGLCSPLISTAVISFWPARLQASGDAWMMCTCTMLGAGVTSAVGTARRVSACGGENDAGTKSNTERPE
ncbi:hypothetical protein BD626DRAFT_516749 [Schizophyllum amplum]|uniref:Uncharacterized protein n=1 Tax=Schizophyllum amplum TaxID=97359 RepID=A0A550BWV3_9AGAR|nr:hypothetical protein BD626DRAFT_516749 [Auriculariopsis ampla]